MIWVRSSRCHTSSCCVEVAIMSAVEWRKSSRSLTESSCVEVAIIAAVDDIEWHKSGVWKTSSLTDNSGPWCVEVAGAEDGGVLVRDTKDKGDGPVLRFTADEWRAFIGGAKLNEFDI